MLRGGLLFAKHCLHIGEIKASQKMHTIPQMLRSAFLFRI
jgi:hypothetical protein